MRLIDADEFEKKLTAMQRNTEESAKELAFESGVELSKIDKTLYFSTQPFIDTMRCRPTIDAVEVVRCRDCIYWKPRHVRLDDGTERDYLPGEDYVDVSVGINVGSQCRVDCGKGFGYTFRADGDFCSRGRRKMDAEVAG